MILMSNSISDTLFFLSLQKKKKMIEPIEI